MNTDQGDNDPTTENNKDEKENGASKKDGNNVEKEPKKAKKTVRYHELPIESTVHKLPTEDLNRYFELEVGLDFIDYDTDMFIQSVGSFLEIEKKHITLIILSVSNCKIVIVFNSYLLHSIIKREYNITKANKIQITDLPVKVKKRC